MILKSLRYIVGLGVAGGLAVLLAPGANAQIEVTGGEMAGEAAFFVPGTDAAGNVTLFDAAVQRLELETSNGLTTTSVFVPSAATFTDNGDGMPNSGDTGVLQGKLTGLAAIGGSTFAFSGRDTVLDFTLSSFTQNLGFDGTLISPDDEGSAPLVFLPVLGASVTNEGFSAADGELQVGEFEADLDA
ncbi:MAG: hypothetical protein RLP02_07665, partial [Coleofasciculus sp. C2-GNP5-27]